MEYRHEWKHEVNSLDLRILRRRLLAVAAHDSYGSDGIYEIRSLYFDTPGDRALREKIDGVNIREKFRLRYYNGDPSFIRLEKKSKVNGLSGKEGVSVTKAQAECLLAGQPPLRPEDDSPLFREFCVKCRDQGLRPKTIVDYTREAFVFPPGHVRVTLDFQIRTGLASTDFFNPDTVTVPAGASPVILEVKWGEFLPDIILDAVCLPGRRACAFSKYAACRLYG
ncbi:MAG: polyphosphate polymerase domain-containing protein [Lachnospiraceae bacterium]|nr:polyphosphate polymerase domain-containing protein [Lachnospiraceae bacterium]